MLLSIAAILVLASVVVHPASNFAIARHATTAERELETAQPGASAQAQANRPARHRAKHQHPHRKQKHDKTAKAASRGKESSRSSGCAGTLEQLPETGFCTHGPDPAPPGFDVSQRVQPLSGRQARAATTMVCDGNGVSGNRVQVLYVRAQDAPNRYSQYLPSIRAWTAGADQILRASAAETGGIRRFRFVTDASCQLDVTDVAVSRSDFGSFDALINALRSRGYSRADRIYLSFVDTNSSGLCSIGTYWADDRPGASNSNNSGPAYSRVDAGCWDSSLVAHELLHNLGGVQRSAPHSTPGGHCIDEWDVMCYQDSTSVSMRVVCSDSGHDDRYDCNHDDYFHTHPPAGSYLATHWNTADSPFLVADNGGLQEESNAPFVAITQPRRGDHPKGKKTISIAADATDAESFVAEVEFRRCSGSSCSWQQAATIGKDTTPPFAVTWKLPKRGTVTFLAQALDGEGNTTVANPVTIHVKKKH